MNNSFFSTAGLAMRAGLTAAGADAGERLIKSGKAALVLIDGSVSERSLKDITDACRYRHVPFIVVQPPFALAQALGKSSGKIFTVTDKGFAARLSELHSQYSQNTQSYLNDNDRHEKVPEV